jgi:hypothetical protein
MRDNFWCFWSETSSLRKIFTFALVFYSLLPSWERVVRLFFHARRTTITLCLLYTFFFSCLFFWGVLTGVLHIWSIPCMLFIGLGFVIILLVSDMTF